tara:strand:- start:288 stop:527 length:240 start_codon:yes stop_codon:yes gene_type:complete
MSSSSLWRTCVSWYNLLRVIAKNMNAMSPLRLGLICYTLTPLMRYPAPAIAPLPRHIDSGFAVLSDTRTAKRIPKAEVT